MMTKMTGVRGSGEGVGVQQQRSGGIDPKRPSRPVGLADLAGGIRMPLDMVSLVH